MSIIRNVLELIHRGYTLEKIAEYTGYDIEYVRKINQLKEKNKDDSIKLI